MQSHLRDAAHSAVDHIAMNSVTVDMRLDCASLIEDHHPNGTQKNNVLDHTNDCHPLHQLSIEGAARHCSNIDVMIPHVEGDGKVRSQYAMTRWDQADATHFLIKSPGPFQSREKRNCPLCHKSMLARVLSRHLKSVHKRQNTTTTHQCLQCRMHFARKDNLDRHVAEKHALKSTYIQCPGCGCYVQRRAFSGHVNTKKCQRLQLQADMDRMNVRKLAWSDSLTQLGRFDITTSVQPLFAAIVFMIEAEKYSGPDIFMPSVVSQSYFYSRGVAMRSIFRALHTPSQVEGPALALALSCLVATANLKFLEGENRVIEGALLVLDQRFNRTFLNGDLLKPHGIGRAMIVEVCNATQLSLDALDAVINCLDNEWPKKRRLEDLSQILITS